jgi:1-acyl-sn-glycerol-3-phosphate acyltransferase
MALAPNGSEAGPTGPIVPVILRSVLFNVLFYLNLLVLLLLALPTLVLPRRAIWAVVRFWARSNNWLLRTICGITVELRGLERMPTGPLLVASKHQSMWETYALTLLFADPAFILKRELMWLPFFGWYAWKADMIPVDRGARSQALAAISARARIELARSRQIVIFPEGTRRPPGAEPRYKYGIAHLYAESGVACLPIALNSGLFWPRRSIRRYPGTIIAEFLDPIAPGGDKQAFFEHLQQVIETATARLVQEGERQLGAADRNRRENSSASPPAIDKPGTAP